METRDIYELRYSYKKQERPIVDFSLPENGRKVSWSLIGQILEDKAPTGLYKPVHLVVKEANATEWDTYSAAGTYGLMSQRAVALVGDSMTLCFEFLEAVTVHTVASRDGAVSLRSLACTAWVSQSNTLRSCRRQVSITVNSRSTNRLPAADCVPNDSFRQITA